MMMVLFISHENHLMLMFSLVSFMATRRDKLVSKH